MLKLQKWVNVKNQQNPLHQLSIQEKNDKLNMILWISGDVMETREQKNSLQNNLTIVNNLWRSL